MISKEEKELRTQRCTELNKLIKKHNIKTGKLSIVSGIKECNLSSMKTGKLPITEVTWKMISEAIEKIVEETEPVPDVEVEDWEYVKQQLARHDNVFVNKKRVKNIKNYLDDLKQNGFDCSYQEVDEGYIISHNQRVIKPMVEITKPKQVIEEDLSIIDKVRNMHQDSLVMHEQALKLQAETDEIVKSVDDMEAKLDLDKPEYKMPKFVPGSSVTGAFGVSVEPVEEIIITKEDIEKALSENSHYELPWEEEEELKELAEETLANCGLEKGIHSVDLVEFLETRLTKLEVRGFLRGKAIESLLEEDYQTASMCIKYFMDNGYIDEVPNA